MFQDLRYSLRSLLKRPGFSAIVVLTLALGIGVNTTLFTIFDIFLKPKPVKEPESIVRVTFEGDRQGDRFSSRAAGVWCDNSSPKASCSLEPVGLAAC